jgi:DNA repair ATPase RecN
VNVIVGPSDAGKSSLVRAIKSATQQAEGHSFVRAGSKKASVAIVLSDEHQVVWEKGKSVNRYTLDGDRFSRVGRSVPEPVAEVLDMTPAKFGETAEKLLQFSEQGEAAFMVADTPSECARILGGVSGAAVVADAVRHAAKNVTNLTRDTKAAEREAEAAAEALIQFEGLDEERECHHKLYKAAESLLDRSVKQGRANEDASEALRITDEFGYAIQDKGRAEKELEAFAELGAVAGGMLQVRDASNDFDGLCDLSKEEGLDRREKAAARLALDAFKGYPELEKRFTAVVEAISAVRAYREAKNRCRDARAVMDRAKSNVDVLSGVGETIERANELVRCNVVLCEHLFLWEQWFKDDSSYSSAKIEALAAKAFIAKFIEENPTCPLCGASMEGAKL